MSHRRERREIVDKGIVAGEPLLQQPPETTFSISVCISVQIIPPHLIYHNSDNQLGPRNDRTMPGLTTGDEQHNNDHKAKRTIPEHGFGILQQNYSLARIPKCVIFAPVLIIIIS
jgi:hypothetical protein